jgi:hypothetical protein
MHVGPRLPGFSARGEDRPASAALRREGVATPVQRGHWGTSAVACGDPVPSDDRPVHGQHYARAAGFNTR